MQEGETATDTELTGVFAVDRHDPIALANEPLLSVITPSETSNMCVFCFTILQRESERKRWGWRGGRNHHCLPKNMGNLKVCCVERVELMNIGAPF